MHSILDRPDFQFSKGQGRVSLNLNSGDIQFGRSFVDRSFSEEKNLTKRR